MNDTASDSRPLSTTFAFGGNDSGQLGIGNDSPCMVPKRVEDIMQKTIVHIACGSHHSVGFNGEGEIFSWGSNEYGQLGRSGRTMIPQQVMALETARIIHAAAGEGHTAVVDKSGELYCMGRNTKGQLGKGDWEDNAKPRKVKNAEGHQFVQVACGGQTTLALTLSGDVLACGEGTQGQMGSGDIVSYHTLTPIPVLFGTPIRQVAAGITHCMALTVSGSIFAWGGNKFGQLGLGDQAGRRHPILLSGLHRKHIKQIACGAFHSAAISDAGMLYTWGQGSCGQLGHGSLGHDSVPQVVFELLGSTVTAVACGRMHTAALVLSHDRAKTFLFGWGAAHNLGLGEKPQEPYVKVPAKISPEELSAEGSARLSSIFAGLGDHTFVQTSTGTAPTYSLPILAHFSVASLRELFATTSSSLEQQKRLSTVFSSPMCLNASFLAAEHLDTGDTICGLDMSAVQEGYRVILSQGTQNPALMNAFGNATARAIAKLPKIPNPARVPERLRVFLIIMENPLLTDIEHSRVLLERFCQAFLGLKEETCQILSQWWRRLSPEYFRRAVKTFNDYLSFLVSRKNEPESPVISAALTLDLLYRINEKGEKIIPYEMFYNRGVSEHADLAKDYKTWRQSSASVFCFCRYPFLLTPDAKSNIIKVDARMQMGDHVSAALYTTFVEHSPSAPCMLLVVRRDHLLEDTLNQILVKQADLKKPLKVVFVGEEAVDQGGVSKEFFQLIVRSIFDPAYGMFTEDENRRMWFNPASVDNLTEFTLIGVILGLAIYNGIILPVRFLPVLFKKLLQREVGLEDLKVAFPEVGKNLEYLLQFDGDVESAFLLNFTVSYDSFGTVATHDLKENGSDIPVINENRHEYVRLYVDWMLNRSVEKQYKAFAEGFGVMCRGAVLGLFNPSELEMLICGSPELNFHELEAVTKYKEPYHKDHPVIKAFWEVVHSYPVELQRKLLAFTTGSDCVPIQGLSKLQFIIQRAGNDATRLPAAHTCFNLLDLPEYPDAETLNEKMQMALLNTQGFGLV